MRSAKWGSGQCHSDHPKNMLQQKMEWLLQNHIANATIHIFVRSTSKRKCTASIPDHEKNSCNKKRNDYAKIILLRQEHKSSQGLWTGSLHVKLVPTTFLQRWMQFWHRFVQKNNNLFTFPLSYAPRHLQDARKRPAVFSGSTFGTPRCAQGFQIPHPTGDPQSVCECPWCIFSIFWKYPGHILNISRHLPGPGNTSSKNMIFGLTVLPEHLISARWHSNQFEETLLPGQNAGKLGLFYTYIYNHILYACMFYTYIYM